MSRFFLPPDTTAPGTSLLSGTHVQFATEDAAHIARVLRLSPGKSVTGMLHGWEYDIRLTSVSPQLVTGVIAAGKLGQSEPPLRVLVAQGLPKGDKFELVVQKATELGAAGIMPVHCERSVARVQPEKVQKRLTRWSRIAHEAAEQSRRVIIPAILPPLTWAEAVALGDNNTTKLVMWEGEKATSLADMLALRLPNEIAVDAACHSHPGDRWDVIIYVGPEGGLSEQEIAVAASHGALPVSLGPRILRTETAALAVLSLVLFAWGDLGRL